MELVSFAINFLSDIDQLFASLVRLHGDLLGSFNIIEVEGYVNYCVRFGAQAVQVHFPSNYCGNFLHEIQAHIALKTI